MAHTHLQVLDHIDSQIISCCSYHRSYLDKLKSNERYFIRIYDHILSKAEALLGGIKKIANAHILDLGCGQGGCGVYAKLKGWGKVSLMDMNPHCIENAKKISHIFKQDNIYFQLGTEHHLDELVLQSGIPDIIVCMDVIEHVYDIDVFLGKIKKIAPQARLVFTTGAVSENPLRARPMKKLQITDEYHYSDELQTVDNNPYAGMPFLKVREDIIHKADVEKKLSNEEKKKLASLTRGMNKDDIEKSVRIFVENKTFPISINHPTNTCDPISSSWTERLLTISQYTTIFHRNQYKASYEPGLYNEINSTGFKKFILSCLNIGVKLLKSPKIGAYSLMTLQPY